MLQTNHYIECVRFHHTIIIVVVIAIDPKQTNNRNEKKIKFDWTDICNDSQFVLNISRRSFVMRDTRRTETVIFNLASNRCVKCPDVMRTSVCVLGHRCGCIWLTEKHSPLVEPLTYSHHETMWNGQKIYGQTSANEMLFVFICSAVPFFFFFSFGFIKRQTEVLYVHVGGVSRIHVRLGILQKRKKNGFFLRVCFLCVCVEFENPCKHGLPGPHR